MIFTHVSLIQEGEAALFYRFDRKLSGYMIAGVIISDTMEARLEFVKVWKYFVSEIVQKDDIYASIPLSVTNSMFTNYTSYYDTIEGRKLYSNYEKHLERAGSNE